MLVPLVGSSFLQAPQYFQSFNENSMENHIVNALEI